MSAGAVVQVYELLLVGFGGEEGVEEEEVVADWVEGVRIAEGDDCCGLRFGVSGVLIVCW